MPKIKVDKAYKFSEDGNTVTSVEEGIQEVSERGIQSGKNMGCIAAKAKAIKAAPANKADQTESNK